MAKKRIPLSSVAGLGPRGGYESSIAGDTVTHHYANGQDRSFEVTNAADRLALQRAGLDYGTLQRNSGQQANVFKEGIAKIMQLPEAQRAQWIAGLQKIQGNAMAATTGGAMAPPPPGPTPGMIADRGYRGGPPEPGMQMGHPGALTPQERQMMAEQQRQASMDRMKAASTQGSNEAKQTMAAARQALESAALNANMLRMARNQMRKKRGGLGGRPMTGGAMAP